MNFIEIFTAWVVSMNPSEEQKQQSLEREKICSSCEKNGFIQKIRICKACGCPIAKKIFSQEYNPCPLKKWEDVDKNYIHLQKNEKTLF